MAVSSDQLSPAQLWHVKMTSVCACPTLFLDLMHIPGLDPPCTMLLPNNLGRDSKCSIHWEDIVCTPWQPPRVLRAGRGKTNRLSHATPPVSLFSGWHCTHARHLQWSFWPHTAGKIWQSMSIVR